MASLTLALSKELKSELLKLKWVVWSELVKQELLRRQELLNKFNSPEEQELIKWSVELGRKAKKDSFKRLLSEISPKLKEELLNSMSPEKREEYKQHEFEQFHEKQLEFNEITVYFKRKNINDNKLKAYKQNFQKTSGNLIDFYS